MIHVTPGARRRLPVGYGGFFGFVTHAFLALGLHEYLRARVDAG